MHGLTETGLRAFGFAFNLALLAAFAWGCMSLWSAAGGWAEWAGGAPSRALVAASLSDPSLMADWLSATAAAFGPARMAGGWAAAWGCAIAAAGSGWMALLGGRWLYHAALRGSMRLP